MAVVVRYNGYTLPNVHEKFGYHENEVEISFNCMFLVKSSTAGGLVGACQTAEEKLTEKCKDFTLSFGGTSELSFSHTGNTGFSAHANLTKLQDELCTETSRNYGFAITIQLPFTQSGYNARREASFSVSYLPTRQRLVTFNELYTSTPSAEAYANYISDGKTWAGTILSALGGNYELINESFQEEQEQKIINANLVYKEILTNQSTSGINDTSIVDPQINYGCSIEQQAGKGIITGVQATPIVRITINYSTGLDKTIVGTDLNTAYVTRVKPYMLSQVFATLGLGSYKTAGSSNFVVESETKNIDPTNYHISGHLTILAFKPTQIIQYSESITQVSNPNIIFKKLWNGEDDTYNMWSMGKTRTIQRTVVIAQLGSEPAPPQALTNERCPDGCKWVQCFPTSTQGRLDIWGYGSEATASTLRSTYVYFFTFVEQYLAVRNATAVGQNVQFGNKIGPY